MSSIEEKLSKQFYEWEIRGRGWQVWDVPISPEPPFRPFRGHYIPPESVPDDGRRPTFLSSLVSRLSRSLSGEAEAPEIPEDEDGPEPEILVRSDLVELHASLPSALNVSKECIEQVLFNLASCREPVSFELIASHDGIITQFAAAEQDAGLLQQQLEAYFPEGVFMPHSCVLERKWHETEGEEALIVDFGLSREFMFPLASARNFNIDPFIGITGALSKLREGELAVLQVIFQSVRHPWGESILRSVSDNTGGDFFVNAPELSKEARSKVSRPLFAAIVRIAIKAGTHERSLEIGRSVAGAFAVFSNPNGNELIPLENSAYPLADHEEDVLRRQTRRVGMLLNSDELVSLVHLPSSSVRTPKLKREAKRTKPAPKTVSHQGGILLGENIHAGKVGLVRLSPEQRVRHMHCIGASGTGKSTFLFNLIQQDIESGQGVAVLEPHGDLIERILGCIPQNRIGDVVLVDPSDEEYSVGFNILAAHSDLEKNLLASDLVSIFQRLSTSWGDQINAVLNQACLAFLESSKGGTLIDLRRFLIEPDFRNVFLKTVSDAEVIYYWKKAFPLLSGNKSVGPIITRLDTFLGRKPIRHMVSQKQNKLDIAEIMNSGKIFLAKLSQGKIGKENAYLLGSFLVSKFQQSAMARQDIPEAQRRDFWLYVDEAHNFITPSMAEILSGARKYRTGLILANQELRQIQREAEVASAVLSNCATRVCFRLGDSDAKALENGFSFFEAKDLQNLETGEAICRVERSDFDFNLAVSLPPEISGAEAAKTREQVITASREKYAVSRHELESELRRRSIAEEESEPIEEKPQKAAPKEDAGAALSEVWEPPASSPASQLNTAQKTSLSEVGISERSELAASETKPVKNRKSAPPTEPGRGSPEHKYLQTFVAKMAESLNYEYSTEQQLSNGGYVDVSLGKAGKKIGCEIWLTTPLAHELENIQKCKDAGCDYVMTLCQDRRKIEKLKKAASERFSPEVFSSLRFGTLEEVSQFLTEFAAQFISKEVVSHGRKLRVVYSPLSEEEAKKKREALAQISAQSVKKLKKKE